MDVGFGTARVDGYGDVGCGDGCWAAGGCWTLIQVLVTRRTPQWC